MVNCDVIVVRKTSNRILVKMLHILGLEYVTPLILVNPS